MRTLIRSSLIVALLALSGCAALNNSLRPKPPIDEQASALQELQPQQVDVAKLPALPQAQVIEDKSGTKWAGFDVKSMNQLRGFSAAAQANTEVLKSLVQTSQAQVVERNALLDLAKQEQARANFLANQWADAKEEANKQQLEKEVNGWAYKAMLLITIIVLH